MEGDEGNKIKIKNTLIVKIGIFLSPLGRTVHDIFLDLLRPGSAICFKL